MGKQIRKVVLMDEEFFDKLNSILESNGQTFTGLARVLLQEYIDRFYTEGEDESQ